MQSKIYQRNRQGKVKSFYLGQGILEAVVATNMNLSKKQLSILIPANIEITQEPKRKLEAFPSNKIKINKQLN